MKYTGFYLRRVMKHKGTQNLITERLILRKFATSDTHATFTNWTNDERVTTFLTWKPHDSPTTTLSVIKEWVKSYENCNFYQWAIQLKSICQPIGSISAVKIDETTDAITVGYCLGSKWWKQGYMSEALAAVIKFFFEEVDVNRIEAKHDVQNPNSGNVMKRCGMTFEGILRQADKNNRGLVDICVYSILKSEYLDIK